MAHAARWATCPFNSETLVTGKLFEDIRDAVFKPRRSRELRRDRRDHQPLRSDRVGRPAPSCFRRRSTAFVSSGSTFPVSACLHTPRRRTFSPARCSRYARRRGQSRDRCPHLERASATFRPSRLIGEMFPADPMGHHRALAGQPMGLAAGPVVPTREWRELYGALDWRAPQRPPSIRSIPRPIRELENAGRPIIGIGAGRRTTGPPTGSRRSARRACGADARYDRLRRRTRVAACDPPVRCQATPIDGPHHAVRLRRLRAARRHGSWSRVARTCALRRYRLSAHALVGCRTASGWRRKGVQRATTALRSKQDHRGDRRSSSRTSRSARRRSSRRPNSPAIAGAVLHEPDLGATTDGTRPAPVRWRR